MRDSLKQFYNQHSTARAVSLSSESKQKVKLGLLANLANPENNIMPEPKGFPWINLKNLFVKSYVVIPLALLLLVGGSTIVSASSLPGDALYPLKRGVETVSVLIAPTEQAKTELKINYAKKRLAELEALNKRNSQQSESANPNNKGIQTNTTITNTNTVSTPNPTTPKSQIRIKAEEDANSAIDLLKTEQKKFQVNNREREAEDLEDQINKFESENEVEHDSEEIHTQSIHHEESETTETKIFNGHN